MPWFRRYFESDDWHLFEAVPQRKRIPVAADFIDETLSLPRGSRLLDLGCGEGLLAIELTRRGFDVTGVDLSRHMLAEAETHCPKRGRRPVLMRRDMRKLKFEAEFDVAICWHSSLGYSTEEDDLRTLTCAARALVPGGLLLVDVPNRPWTLNHVVGDYEVERRGLSIHSRITYTRETHVMTCYERIIEPNSGRERSYTSHFRLYSLTELKRLLRQAGLEFLQVYGDDFKREPGDLAWRPEGYGPKSQAMVVLASRE